MLFAATAAGATAYLWGPSVVFYLLAIMSAASLIGIGIIPGRAIDNELARGLHDRLDEQDNPLRRRRYAERLARAACLPGR